MTAPGQSPTSPPPGGPAPGGQVASPVDRLSGARPALLAAAALLGAASLGLVWNTIPAGAGDVVEILGRQHPMRAFFLPSGVLIGWGLLRGRRSLSWAGVAVGAVALPLQPGTGPLAPGRLALAGALLLTGLALSAGASDRRPAAADAPGPGTGTSTGTSPSTSPGTGPSPGHSPGNGG
ncbi:MAG: hypothetical protein P8Z68_08295 [Kineosporiaceae bacterium]